MAARIFVKSASTETLTILLFPCLLIYFLRANSEAMDSIIHFEIPADDTKRAGEFYMKAFGWMVNPMPEMNYTMIGTTPSDEKGMPQTPGAINGGMPKRGEPVKNIVVTIGVQNIDDSLAKVEKLGGKRMGDKMSRRRHGLGRATLPTRKETSWVSGSLPNRCRKNYRTH